MFASNPQNDHTEASIPILITNAPGVAKPTPSSTAEPYQALSCVGKEDAARCRLVFKSYRRDKINPTLFQWEILWIEQKYLLDLYRMLRFSRQGFRCREAQQKRQNTYQRWSLYPQSEHYAQQGRAQVPFSSIKLWHDTSPEAAGLKNIFWWPKRLGNGETPIFPVIYSRSRGLTIIRRSELWYVQACLQVAPRGCSRLLVPGCSIQPQILQPGRLKRR
jgi:hypothetical protein